MYYYIYKITNLVNNIFYIGSHKTQDLNDDYFGSGIYLKSAIKKHGRGSFKKEIVLYCSSEAEMREKETEYLLDIRGENVYNLKFCALGGNTRSTYTKKEKEQYIQKLIDNPDSPIGKKGTDAFNYGKSHSKETTKKQSKSHKDRWKIIKNNPSYDEYRRTLREHAISNLSKMVAVNKKSISVFDNKLGCIYNFTSKTECMDVLGISQLIVDRIEKGERINDNGVMVDIGTEILEFDSRGECAEHFNISRPKLNRLLGIEPLMDSRPIKRNSHLDDYIFTQREYRYS